MPPSNLHTQKRRTNRAILIALFAWVVLLFVLTLIKMTPATGETEVKSTYDVPPAYQACDTDADCAVVSTTCNGCCQRGAIRQDHVDIFNTERAAACTGYHGAVCRCSSTPVKSSCTNHRCILVPVSLPGARK